MDYYNSDPNDPWRERHSGRGHKPQDKRGHFERDRARILHSAAFRRLQATTQVLGLSEGDFHRSRLTHTLEVAQISRSLVTTLHWQLFQRRDKLAFVDSCDTEYKPEPNEIDDARKLLPRLELAEAIAFGHDLGHPPFGHAGETALNYAMRDAGGFEGNGQALRVLTYLDRNVKGYGMDLTRRTLLGVLKYPRRYTDAKWNPPKTFDLKGWKPPKCYLNDERETVSWILRSPPLKRGERTILQTPAPDKTGKERFHKSLDASLIELADDISNGVHDIEDAVRGKFLKRQQWEAAWKKSGIDEAWWRKKHLGSSELVAKALWGPRESARRDPRKTAIGDMVNALVDAVRLKSVGGFQTCLFKYNVTLGETEQKFLETLELIKEDVIKTRFVQTRDERNATIVLALFDAIEGDTATLLDESFKQAHSEARPGKDRKRVVADGVASMSDSYALTMLRDINTRGGN
jgi:dGTPase